MTHVPRLFCFCGGEMRNEKMGTVLEALLVSQDARPYFKVSSDLMKCVECDNQVFLIAREPLAYPHEDKYERFKASHEVHIRG